MEQNTINPIPFSLYLQRVQNKREKLSPLSKIRSPEKKEEDGGQRCSDAVVGLSAAALELFLFFFQIFFTSKGPSLPLLLRSSNTFLKTQAKTPRSTF